MTQANSAQNEVNIYTALCAKYPDDIVSITEISKNTRDQRDFIVSSEKTLNYDKVMNCSASYSMETDEKSPDALFLNGDTLYFVEFKEGTKVKKIDVRGKIHEGVATLYHFAKKHLSLSKVDFLNLNICYLVFRRPRGFNSVLNALETASAEYNLKNLEGFIVKKTGVIDDPQFFVDFFNRVSSGQITEISVFDHCQSGAYSTFTANNSASVPSAQQVNLSNQNHSANNVTPIAAPNPSNNIASGNSISDTGSASR